MGVPRTAFSRAMRRFYDIADGVLNGANDGDVLLGAPPAVTGLTVTEEGFGPFRRTVLHFEDVAVALVDEAGVVAYKGTKVYDFPLGSIKIFGAVADLALTKSSAGVSATWNGDFSLGTVTASNNATLSSTEQDIIPTTATPQAVAGATTAKGKNAADIAPLDGTGTAIDAYLNLLVDDADHDVTSTPCNIILNGTVVISWMNLGDC